MKNKIIKKNQIKNPTTKKIPKMEWEEIARRFGHLTLPEAFEARKKLYLEEGL